MTSDRRRAPAAQAVMLGRPAPLAAAYLQPKIDDPFWTATELDVVVGLVRAARKLGRKAAGRLGRRQGELHRMVSFYEDRVELVTWGPEHDVAVEQHVLTDSRRIWIGTASIRVAGRDFGLDPREGQALLSALQTSPWSDLTAPKI